MCLMISLGKFLEFWLLFLRAGGTYFITAIGFLSNLLLIYKFIRYLRRVSATILLRYKIKLLIPRKEQILVVFTLYLLVFLVIILFDISLIYSIEGSPTLTLLPDWRALSFLFLLSYLTFGIFLYLSDKLTGILEKIINVKRIYREAFGQLKFSGDYSKYCSSCRGFFKISNDTVVVNLTHDLILGFKCPHCGYIIKL